MSTTSLDTHILNMIPFSYEMPTLGNITTLPTQDPSQPEARPADGKDAVQSFVDEESNTNAPEVHLNQVDSTALEVERQNIIREIELGIENLARPTSPPQTESQEGISAAMEDVPEVSTSSGPNLISAAFKKCISPMGLAVLTLVTAGIYFALQYGLSAEANRLSLRESCRSHPVRFHIIKDDLQPLNKIPE